MKKISVVLVLIGMAITSLNAQKITPEELDEWNFLGQGMKMVESHNMFFMKEDPQQSKGVMIVSPKSYSDKVTVKYDVMTMTPATVLVAILSASDLGQSTNLSTPQNYDGSKSFWINDVESYFYAFRNAPHNFTPFIRKYPVAKGEDPALVSMDKNIMLPGVFYSIELGQNGEHIWLKVDGEKVLETKDDSPMKSGHIAFRIRGTAGEYAACLVRNVEIIEKN